MPSIVVGIVFGFVALAAIGFAAWVVVAVCVALARGAVRKPRMPGHCPRCEYNLTGNTSDICPECGLHLRARLTP